MNTRIEIFYERLSITFFICKFGLFLWSLIYIYSESIADWYINELKIISLECIFMFLCLGIYILIKAYHREVLVLPNDLQLEREE
jgi:hypothetical protein